MPPIIGHAVLGSIRVRCTHESGHVGKLTTFNGGSWLKALGFDESGEGKNLRVRPLHPDLFQNRLELLAETIKGRSRLPNIDHAPATRRRPGNVCEHSPNWPVGKPLSSSFQYHLDAFFVFSPCRRAAKFKKDSNGHGISPCSSDLKSLSEILVNAALLPKAYTCIAAPCPLWVKSRHVRRASSCPLLPQKRTCAVQRGMSALGQ